MKKRYFKGILCGLMAGVTTMCTFTVAAQQIQKKIDVSYRNIKIYADGKLVNTNGDNEAFIYNGTTYLPVRAVGEAFNKAVDWDGKTASVYLGTRPTNSSRPTVLLEDLDYFTKSAEISELFDTRKDNLGYVHASGYMLHGSGGEIEYLLNGKYNRFSGTVGVPYNRRDSDRETGIKIYGDGKLLYSSSLMCGGIKPENFDINVSGVLNLKIEVLRDEIQTGCYYTTVCIYDAGFYA